jgi:hypothetical protein
VPYVSHDPDHSEPGRPHALTNASSDRICAVGPERFREGLVDDDDTRLVRAFAAVLIGEYTSALQPDAHRLEVSG